MSTPYDRYIDRISHYERKPIPRVIHQMWLSRDETKDIPEKEQRLSYNVEINIPNVLTRYKFWSNKEIKELWETEELLSYKECFYKAEPHIIRCDMTRYAIMYVHGGIYMDMDCILTDKSLIEDYEADQIYYYEDSKLDKIYNGYLVSRPHNPLWLLLLDIICEKLSKNDYKVHSIPEVYATSGPVMLGKTVHRLLELRPDHTLIPYPHVKLPVKIDQPSMSSWKAELIKHEVQSTGYQWYYIILVLIPILFLLIFIMWYWTQNSLRRDVVSRLNNKYKNTGYRFS